MDTKIDKLESDLKEAYNTIQQLGMCISSIYNLTGPLDVRKMIYYCSEDKTQTTDIYVEMVECLQKINQLTKNGDIKW